jgi:hypothetical protein
MKKIIVTLSIAALSFTAMAAGDHLGKPQQVDGLNVYIMSEPVDPYYKLGQVGSGTSSKLNDMLKQAIKNVKKQYPDADGVIFDPEKNLGYGIKFK